MYQSHSAELTKLLGVTGDERLTTVALHALSKLAKSDPSVIPDKSVLPCPYLNARALMKLIGNFLRKRKRLLWKIMPIKQGSLRRS